MGRKRKAPPGPNPGARQPPKPDGPTSAEALARIGDVERRMLAELAKLQKAVERERAGMMAFSRTVNTLLIPVRVALWMTGAVFHPIASAKILRDWLYIRRSGRFDAAFYLRVYPDVMAAASNPILHYCEKGWREMRNPRSDFVTAAYLERNPDVKLCGMNPFYHYVRYRGAEPYREGTGRPFAANALPAPAHKLPKAGPDLKRVPAPLSSETLCAETVARIAAETKRGLYENA